MEAQKFGSGVFEKCDYAMKCKQHTSHSFRLNDEGAKCMMFYKIKTNIARCTVRKKLDGSDLYMAYGGTFILRERTWQFSRKGTGYKGRGKWGLTFPHSFSPMVAKLGKIMN